MDAPYKGKRKISFMTYFCRSQAVFKHGAIKPEDILGSTETVKEINFDGIGWKEATENKLRVMELSLELALLVANADGSIDDVSVQRGIGAGCDEAATEVIESTPSWSPGKQRGKAVKVSMVIPVRFKIS